MAILPSDPKEVQRLFFEHQPHVYKLTLLKDVDGWKKGAVYIGQTNANKQGYVTGGKIPKMLAKKYGWNIFDRETIAVGNLTRRELSDIEILKIKEYDSVKSGMNIASGGSGSKRVPVKLYRYALSGEYIDEWASSQTVLLHFGGLRNSLGTVIRHVRSNPENTHVSFMGYLWSSDKLERVPRYKRGYFDIYQYSLSGEFIQAHDSPFDARRTLNLHHQHPLYEALDNEYRSSAGYQWRSYKVENIGKFNRPHHAARAVVCYTLDDVYVASYYSISEAARNVKGCPVVLNKALIGLNGRESVYGYKWKFKDAAMAKPNN